MGKQLSYFADQKSENEIIEYVLERKIQIFWYSTSYWNESKVLVKVAGNLEQEYNKLRNKIKKKVSKYLLPVHKGSFEFYATEEMIQFKDKGYIYM
jgi:hypothetical protein